MPVSGALKLIDANVWLALSFSDHAHHEKATKWFEAQSEGACAFCRITQLALLRHLTNVKIMGAFVQSQQDAWKNLDNLMADPRIVFLAEPAGVEPAFRPLRKRRHRFMPGGRMPTWRPSRPAMARRSLPLIKDSHATKGWILRFCNSRHARDRISGAHS